MRETDAAIRAFVEQHIGWIQKKQAEIGERVIEPPSEYLPGEMFLFLGESYPLEIVKHQRQPLLLDGNFKLADSALGRAGLVFEGWYRTEAKKILQDRVGYYATQYGFQYQGIKITSAKTRWGSCSGKGALSFSWRLILAPLEQVDYVVVHELVHTVHHNHSKRFWNKVANVLPDYEERRQWLRKQGPRLMD
jgi:predicted metal-dependent hydrolase